MQHKIAALACSYNRLKKTTSFLASLTAQATSEEFSLDIYILDDNSKDGTPEFIRDRYPEINLISGTGSLFWAGGMRKLWRYALHQKQYDYFLLLNDDVILFDNAVANLFRASQSLGSFGHVLVGTVQDPSQKSITYGGRALVNKYSSAADLVIPDASKLLKCDIGNANIMLVDKEVVAAIGIFADTFTHGIADYDYTLRARKKGCGVWVPPGYYGICEYDHGNNWLPQKVSLPNRIKYLFSPKGLGYQEYCKYIWQHFPLYYPEAVFKLWAKTFFPFIWDHFKVESK